LDDELLGSKAGQIQGPSSAVAMAFSSPALVLGVFALCRLQTADCLTHSLLVHGGRQAPRSQGLVPRASPPPFPDPGSQSPRLPDCDFMLHPPPRCRTTSSFPPSRRGTGFNHLPWGHEQVSDRGPACSAAFLPSQICLVPRKILDPCRQCL